MLSALGRIALIDSLTKQTPGLKVRDVLAWHADSLSRFGIPAGSGHSIPEPNTPKPAILDPISRDQCSSHMVKDCVH